jgi:(4S)-4-hydroxy-5-phosphonooxypentane-2,3-dione isomerase
MYVTLVHVHVKPGREDEFASASLENAAAALDEPGNVFFEILRQSDDPTRFVLYEAYETKEAAAAHKDTPHYQKWREAVADWMAEPRKGVVYEGLDG